MARKPSPRPATLLANVAVVCAQCGLSDYKIGAALGVNHTTVMRWRRQLTLPADLSAFIAWCGVTEDTLRNGTTEQVQRELTRAIREGKCAEAKAA